MSLINKLISKKWWILIVIILVGGFAYEQNSKGEEIPFDTEVATNRTLQEVVLFSGAIEPASKVSLAFEKAGRVSYVNADVGDFVPAGKIIAQVNNQDIKGQLDQAKASVSIEESTLSELKRGSRPEELAVKQSQYDAAVSSRKSAEATMRDVLLESFAKADDVIRNSLDPLFDNDATSPTLVFRPNNSQKKTDIENARSILESKLNDWKALIDTGKNDISPKTISLVEDNLAAVNKLLDDITAAFVNSERSNSISQTTFDTWRAAVSVARSTITATSQKVTSADEKLSSAKTAEAIAKNQLSLAEAGATAESISAQEARVLSAQAKVDQYEAELNKTYLTAPFDGVISTRLIEPGEIVGVNTPAISMISKAKYEIKANVSELDVSKLAVGGEAEVTLDAYGKDQKFKAKVSRIDPAETKVGNSPAYGVVLQLTDETDRIKAGMTANVRIVTKEIKDVLAVPVRAVVDRDGKDYVRIINDQNKAEEKEVVLGMRASDSYVQITSGINKDDRVVVGEKK